MERLRENISDCLDARAITEAISMYCAIPAPCFYGSVGTALIPLLTGYISACQQLKHSSSCCRAAVDKACSGREYKMKGRWVGVGLGEEYYFCSLLHNVNKKLDRIELIVVPVLGLAVLLFEMLSHEDCGITQLLDVGNVVILGNVNPANCS
ncbi:hypothetical protein V6N11_051571 [Hibiscus sabdariffa]|uniref:Uncharacterized protein n=1 Tax=Hibiscus sabdariffa TaxID=183260 RepID=A0ABR2U7S1_9ROSI